MSVRSRCLTSFLYSIDFVSRGVGLLTTKHIDRGVSLSLILNYCTSVSMVQFSRFNQQLLRSYLCCWLILTRECSYSAATGIYPLYGVLLRSEWCYFTAERAQDLLLVGLDEAGVLSNTAVEVAAALDWDTTINTDGASQSDVARLLLRL